MFTHFCGRELTQSGDYNYCLLAHHPINWEERQRKIFPLVIASLPVFIRLDFYHRSNNLYIPSEFKVSTSVSLNLASIIAFVWISCRLRIDMSPPICWTLPPWRTLSSDLMRLKWIRGSLHTKWWEKLVLQDGCSRHVYQFDMQLLDLCWVRSASDAPTRFACNCRICFGGWGY